MTLREPDLQTFFRQMILIRSVETALLALFAEGLLRGTVHTCLGQEATAVGVIAALERQRDLVCSNHRGHGHYLAYCGDAAGLIAEVMGKPSGVCGGIGGSQHLQRENFYANGIVGGMAPVATGMALAEKWRSSGAVTVAFLGDGALAEGAVYEALNMAALWQAPILFAIEQNQFAQSTPWQLEHAGDLARRAEPFGIPVSDVDGNDVAAVHAEAQEAVAAIRTGHGPRLLFMRTYRLAPHSKEDDQRDPAELARHTGRAPIQRLRARLPAAWCDEVEASVAAQVAATVAALREA